MRQVSGVPPLERAGDKKWGNVPKWQEYKEYAFVYSLYAQFLLSPEKFLYSGHGVLHPKSL